MYLHTDDMSWNQLYSVFLFVSLTRDLSVGISADLHVTYLPLCVISLSVFSPQPVEADGRCRSAEEAFSSPQSPSTAQRELLIRVWCPFTDSAVAPVPSVSHTCFFHFYIYLFFPPLITVLSTRLAFTTFQYQCYIVWSQQVNDAGWLVPACHFWPYLWFPADI